LSIRKHEEISREKVARKKDGEAAILSGFREMSFTLDEGAITKFPLYRISGEASPWHLKRRFSA
jgi:hypothetical protein